MLEECWKIVEKMLKKVWKIVEKIFKNYEKSWKILKKILERSWLFMPTLKDCLSKQLRLQRTKMAKPMLRIAPRARDQKQLNDGDHGQGTHSSKMGTDTLAKNTQNAVKQFWMICPIGPKVWDIIEKRLHRASVVRAF